MSAADLLRLLWLTWRFKAGPHLFKATPCTPKHFIGGSLLHIFCADLPTVPIHSNISGTLVDNLLFKCFIFCFLFLTSGIHLSNLWFKEYLIPSISLCHCCNCCLYSPWDVLSVLVVSVCATVYNKYSFSKFLFFACICQPSDLRKHRRKVKIFSLFHGVPLHLPPCPQPH